MKEISAQELGRTRDCRHLACENDAAFGSDYCVEHQAAIDTPNPWRLESAGANGWRWTRSAVIQALRAWAQEHGRAPTTKDWQRAKGAVYPNFTVVYSQFGSWGEALEAADLKPVAANRRRRVAALPAPEPVPMPEPEPEPEPPPASEGDRVALAVLAAGRAFVETLERELLEAAEREAA